MFLLDTSVLTRLRAPTVVERVQDLDGSGRARTSMTDLEIGFSARSADEWDRLVAALAAFRPIDVMSFDADFDHIAAVTGQPTHWIVERGSID